MARGKQNRGPARKKNAGNTANSPAAAASIVNTPDEGLLPFPYPVTNKTLKTTMATYLEQEVAKHHDTAAKLADAMKRLEGLGTEGAALGGQLQGGMDERGRGGVMDQDDEDDMGGEQGSDEEDLQQDEEAPPWGGLGETVQEDSQLSGKVRELEQSMATIAHQGLQAVSHTDNASFQCQREHHRGKDEEEDAAGNQEVATEGYRARRTAPLSRLPVSRTGTSSWRGTAQSGRRSCARWQRVILIRINSTSASLGIRISFR